MYDKYFKHNTVSETILTIKNKYCLHHLKKKLLKYLYFFMI